jgi:hypothetical protein
MTEEIRYTLLTDGRSDRALMRLLNWLLKIYFPNSTIQHTWADLSKHPNPPKKLQGKIKKAIELNPRCDILFIHRDAERESLEFRVEIGLRISPPFVN